MPDKLQKHFLWMGATLYLVALLIVRVCFRAYALQPLWMAWGTVTVLFFFGLTSHCHRRWRNDSAKTFLRKVFWWALSIRLAYVGTIIFYYYWQTGVSFEYQAADSWMYHRVATYLSRLIRDGRFHEAFLTLNGRTMGFSDRGYLLYLTGLYTCFGNNILGPRLLKALMSAYVCVAVYKLASRSLGEKTGRLAAVMAVFLPQFIHYNGTYLKETELVFLATLALERMDYLIRSRRYTFINILLPILLTALTFGFRTVVGMALLIGFVFYIIFCNTTYLYKKTRIIILGITAVIGLIFLFTPIGWEMLVIFKVNFLTSDALVEKYQAMGLKYAEYAHYKYMAPGAFTLPLTNLVEVANENQKMMTGTYFVKNYLAFFAMWCWVASCRQKRCRDLSLIGGYTVVYALILAFSFAFNSERYHLPAMPGLLILAAYGMTYFKRKDFAFFYGYNVLLLAAIIAWNYIKLAARGLIF